MAEIQHNARFNEFVVSLGKSLLQYADESWPWIGASEAETQSTFHRLAGVQRQAVAALVELLDQREWTVDFGTYPTDYTDLQFLSLDYFLARILAGERALVADLDEAVHSCADDAEGVKVIGEVLAAEKQILAKLEAVAAARKNRAVAAG